MHKKKKTMKNGQDIFIENTLYFFLASESEDELLRGQTVMNTLISAGMNI